MKHLITLLFTIFVLSLSAQEFNGLWKTKGYGFAFFLEDEAAQVIDITSISAVPSFEASISNDTFFLDGDYFGNLEFVDDNLIMRRIDDNIFELEPLDSLTNLIAEPTQDPKLIFDIFWQTYEEHCAIFPVTNVDWQESFDTFRPMVTDSTTSVELFEILSNMLEPLNDGHSSLINFDDGLGFGGGPDANPYWNPEELGLEVIMSIAQNYLGGNLTLTQSGFIGYGTINDSIGYINVASMAGYIEEGNSLEDNEAFRLEIIEAFEAVKDKNALILDIRFNGGGEDLIARTLAGYLTTEEKLVYTKQAREGDYDEYIDSVAFSVNPQEVTYFADQPIIALTSDYTASAAEILTMCLNQIPNVTTVGEPTYGIFSDAIPKALPNGWIFTISTERYLTPDGINYEQLGFPPNIEVFGDTSLLAQGTDNILERAIEELDQIITSIAEFPNFVKPVTIFPNPIKDQINVQFTLDRLSSITFKLFDAQGKLIQELGQSAYSSGEHIFQWNGYKLAPGVYFLEISENQNRSMQKLIKQ